MCLERLLNSTWCWGDRVPSVFPHPVISGSIQFIQWESGVGRAFLLPHTNYHDSHFASGHYQYEDSTDSMCRVASYSRHRFVVVAEKQPPIHFPVTVRVSVVAQRQLTLMHVFLGDCFPRVKLLLETVCSCPFYVECRDFLYLEMPPHSLRVRETTSPKKWFLFAEANRRIYIRRSE